MKLKTTGDILIGTAISPFLIIKAVTLLYLGGILLVTNFGRKLIHNN